MKTNLTIKNFRVFDENGVAVELNPITILTGCNSSGKSSIVKAVFLLNSFLKQVKNDIDNGNPVRLDEYKLDFSSYPNNLLGRFDKVIHADSPSKTITIEYTAYSLMLSKDVKTRLVFSTSKNDELNNAYLNSISMMVDNDVFFASSKSAGVFSKGNHRNCNVIKEACLDYLQIEYICDLYFSLCSNYEIEGSVSKESFIQERDKLFSELRKYDRNRLKDVVNHIYYRRDGFGNIIRKNKAEYLITEWTREHESFFMIPIIEQLNALPKERVWETVKDIIKRSKFDLVEVASKKIVDDFISSDSETFGEYFKEYESSFLNNIEPKFNNGRNYYSNCPNISLNLSISQEYLAFDPRQEIESIACLEDMPEQNTEDPTTPEQRLKQWQDEPIDFDMIYEIVMLWNTLAGNDNPENFKYYTKTEAGFFQINTEYNHKMLQLLRAFVTELLQELVTPDWCYNMDYVSSSRVSVKRMYSLEENNDFTQLLKKYFEGQRIYHDEIELGGIRERDYTAGSFMNKWLRAFEIGDSLSISVDNEGLGVRLVIHKTKDDSGRLLADEGYGITQLASVLLQIETSIVAAKKRMVHHYCGMEAFRNLIDNYNDEKPREATIAIEEPEIHLHPAYQSMLADMIVEAYKVFNVHFIIETHSEYLIRKLQVLVAGKDNEEKLKISNDDISIVYVNSPKVVEEKGERQVKRIEICADGYLDDTFGEGFFDEATKWSKKLMF